MVIAGGPGLRNDKRLLASASTEPAMVIAGGSNRGDVKQA